MAELHDAYKVVINHEEQYRVVRIDEPIPRGWRETGTAGTGKQCLAFIEEVWTDMRPADFSRLRSDLGLR